MWGLILSLPLLVAAAVFIIQKIPNQKIRRSLQFATLCSLAIHLLFVIFAACSQIFPPVPTEKKVATAPSRTERVLFVQRRKELMPWQKTEATLPSEETLEEVTTPSATSEAKSTANPQPSAAESSAASDAASRRERSSETVPKLADSPSERRRSESTATPASGGNLKSSATSPKTSTARPTAESASKMQPDRETAKSATTAASSGAPKTNTTSTDASQPAKRSTAKTELNSAAPDSAQARLNSRTAEIAASAKVATTESSPSKSSRSETTPTESAAAPARSAESTATAKASQGDPKPTASPAASSQAASRREQRADVASLSALDRQPQPVRSKSESPTVSSPKPVESPSVATIARGSASSQPQAAETSVTRAEKSGALAQRNSNLSPENLTSDGAAAQASSAATRREASQNSELAESLTSQQASPERRSVTRDVAPASTLTTNTTAAASLRGKRNPDPQSAESSAASQSSSMAHEAKRVATEQGESVLDTGATKSVADANPEKKTMSGGGLENLGPLQTEDARSTERESSGQLPSLAADQIAATQAQRGSANAASAPSANPSESSLELNRPNGTTANSQASRLSDKDSNMPGATGDSEANDAQASRRSEQQNESADMANFEPGEESQSGNARTSLSRAPTIDSQIKLADYRGTGTSRGNESATAAVESANSGSARSIDAQMRSGNADSSGPSSEAAGSYDSELSKNSASKATADLGSGAAENPMATQGRTARSNTLGPSQSTEVSTESSTTRGRGKDTLAPTANFESDRVATSARMESSDTAGPSGLGNTPSLDAGTPDRPASRESMTLQTDSESRFKRDKSGARPATRTDVVASAEAFRNRSASAAGGPTTEPSIELGLQFLARYQHADGSWTLGEFDANSPRVAQQFNSDSAATGLALLAFQGAGYTHREFKYAVQMQRGINWLIEHQSADGCLYVESDPESNKSARLYSHAIATLVLTEAYGMTQDPLLREPCERALAYIEATQDPQHGGWRYYSGVRDRRTDTSVTGWMLMALQSGRLARLNSKPETWARIEGWLDLAQDPVSPGTYRYDPFAAEIQIAQRQVSPAMTGVGLLMRLYMGWEKNDSRMLAGADYLLKYPPNQDSMDRRDTYYWYYATQVLRHVGGERWNAWNSQLHPLLVESQVKTGDLAGSWHPYEPIPDRWGKSAGRLYVTTMNLLSLEVDYRLLPLYNETKQ